MKATEIRALTDDIDALAYWVHDYATTMKDDGEREKMAEASGYIHLLKQLIGLCPDDVLNKLQL